MNVFVTNEIRKNIAILQQDEAFHCFKVLRKRSGDRVRLIDGKGNFYDAEIENIDKRSCSASIINSWKEAPRPYYLHMAVAPTKNISRFEWFVEKAIEIGIDEISPILCEHSERKNINLERLKKVALSAVKQSLSASIPLINEFDTLETLIAKTKSEKMIFAHFDEGGIHLKKLVPANSRYTILIGPEGDFSTNELTLLKQQNWQSAILGIKRLRTETAAVVATQIINGLHF